MKNLTSLILFASTLVASCSSPSYVHHAGPSLAVGAHRIAVTASMSGAEIVQANDVNSAGLPENEDSMALELTLGQVVAQNFELGGMFTYGDSDWDDGLDGNAESSSMYGLGAYGRFYIPAMMPGGMVPWIQASLLFAGTMTEEESTDSGTNGNLRESELFGTALSLGVTNYLSESAAIEFAISTSTLDQDSFTGTDTTNGATTAFNSQGLTRETSSVDFTVGMSINF
jgi:outer membrane protein W